MSHVISKDGTRIALARSGSGPALILVDGALCSRAFGPSPKLAPLLAPHFTVYTYDRRGRGESGDTEPYSPHRELEDLAALIEAAGGQAFLLGLSSGGALALHAAASGLPVARVFAYEPPYVSEDSQLDGSRHEAELKPAGCRPTRRRGEVLHAGHGRSAGADWGDDAADAMDLAQARSGRAHVAPRCLGNVGIQDSA